EDADASHVAARPCQSGGETGIYKIVTNGDYWKRLGRCLRRTRCLFAKGKQHGSAISHECFGKLGKSLKVALGEAHFDPYILAIDQPRPSTRRPQEMRAGMAGTMAV